MALCMQHSHPGVAVRALVNIRLADNEQDVLGPPQGHSRDALDVLQAELRNGLACLLLVAVVDSNGCASGDIGLACLARVIRVAAIIVLDLGGGGLLGLVRKLFDARVGHGA